MLCVGALITARAEHGTVGRRVRCRITPVEAIHVALKKVGHGRALQANFEFDEGKWVYGVIVVSGKPCTRSIDPMTGKVADVENVTPAGEAKELEAAFSRAIGSGAITAKRGGREERRRVLPEWE